MAQQKLKVSNPYPRSPRTLTKVSWFYEEPEGLIVVMECRDGHTVNGTYHGTVTATVPWKAVIAAVETHKRIQEK